MGAVSTFEQRETHVNWSRRFHLLEFYRNSLWPVPVASIPVSALLLWLITFADQRFNLPNALEFSPSAATNVLTAMIAAMISFLGFVLTIVVLVIQVSTSSYSPRMLIFIYRDWRLKISLAFFVGTIVYGFLLLARVEEGVTNLAVIFAGLLVVVSLIIFLQFLSHLFHILRPGKMATDIAEAGHRIIEEIYPLPAPPTDTGVTPLAALRPKHCTPRVVMNPGIGGVLQAIDQPGLAQMAIDADAVIVLLHAIGDFISTDEPLLEIFEEQEPLPTDTAICGHVAFGNEWALDQDPAVALRVLVDMAVRALAPGSNDPTTAVQALDRIEDLLVDLGRRDLDTGVRRDADGAIRLVVPMRTWEEFLRFGVTEIREACHISIQVSRRLSSLLHTLWESVPADRKPAVEKEIGRLHKTLRHGIPIRSDRHFAEVPDAQGFGPADQDSDPF